VLLSPLLGGHCRFWPSCSAYAEEAIQRHGAWRGARLALGRLLRCQPFARGGIDMVP
jgi:putative membrane protein insertion efficiency factor